MSLPNEEPAVEPEPRYGDGTGGMVCKLCGLDWLDERETLEPHTCPPGFVKIASAIRALPDEEPPDGWQERLREKWEKHTQGNGGEDQ